MEKKLVFKVKQRFSFCNSKKLKICSALSARDSEVGSTFSETKKTISFSKKYISSQRKLIIFFKKIS